MIVVLFAYKKSQMHPVIAISYIFFRPYDFMFMSILVRSTIKTNRSRWLGIITALTAKLKFPYVQTPQPRTTIADQKPFESPAHCPICAQEESAEHRDARRVNYD